VARRRIGLPRAQSLTIAISLTLLAMVKPTQVRGAAWLRQEGEAYAKASVSVLGATEMFNAAGERQALLDPARYKNPKYSELGAALYVEYGIRPWLTLLGGIPFKVATREADGSPGVGDLYGQEYGLGDLKLGLRAPLHCGRWVAAIEPELKLPLYSKPRPESSAPGLGSGFVDGGIAVSVGAALASVRGYAQGSLGYRVRGGSTAEEIYWDLEAGMEAWRSLRLRLRTDALDSRNTSANTSGLAVGAPVPNAGEQDVVRIAPTMALALGGPAELSVTWRRILDGANTIRSSEWELALAFQGTVVSKSSKR
jgi:hypothetical protein